MILILGANGYLASHFAKNSIYSSSVIKLTRHDSKAHYVIEYSGVKKKVSLEEAFLFAKSKGANGVVNFAASTTKGDGKEALEELISANVTFSSLAANYASNLEFDFFLQISTFSKYTSNGLFKPQTAYAASKAAGESFLAYFTSKHRTRSFVIDLFDVYGPNHHPNKLIPQAMQAFSTGRVFKFATHGTQKISPIFVNDVIEALDFVISQSEHLAAEGSIKHFALPGPEQIQVKQLISDLAELFENAHYEFPPEHDSKSVISVASSPHPLIPGFIPRTRIKEGLRQTIELL